MILFLFNYFIKSYEKIYKKLLFLIKLAFLRRFYGIMYTYVVVYRK